MLKANGEGLSVMAAPKRKVEDDEPLRLLREIVSIGQNRFCVDCGQRGPTYVNMTIGSFICTSCSGHLRGLNPPHRVKSITMASFTADEIDFIRSRGNEFCNKVWGPPKEELERRAMVEDGNARLLDLLIQKYERKRWYCQPTDDMYAEARKTNMSTISSKQTERTETSHSSQAVVGSQSVQSLHSVHSIQRPSPISARSTSSQLSSPSSPATQPGIRGLAAAASSTATQQQQQQATSAHNEAFANFANFDAVSSSTVGAVHQFTSPSQFAPQPHSVFDAVEVQTFTVGVTKPSPADKYAVLASVDMAATAINWSGQINTTCQSDSTLTSPSNSSIVSAAGFSSPAAVTGTSAVGSNPFAVGGGVYPARMTLMQASSPQYMLVQTGSGACYVPVTYSPFLMSPPPQQQPVFSPPPPPTAPAVAAVAFQLPNPQQMTPVAVHAQMHPANPFLNSPMFRRDGATNPFL